MARLSSWLSQDVIHALGWALIHSLWQCVGLAALAAILMALAQRPTVRYLIGAVTLALMLAAPTATFLVLLKPTPAHTFHAAPPRRLAVRIDPQSALPAADVPLNAMKSGDMLASVPEHPISPPQFLSPTSLSPNLLPWLVMAWLAGVVLFSLRFAGGLLLLEHYRRQSVAAGPRLLALAHDLQRQLGLNRAIRYLECAWLQTPAVIGWIRPVLLLPLSALTGLGEAQLRAVIAHELAHIARHDFFVNLLQILVETLLFYHPAIWWLNRRIRAERELCSDEIAVSLTGDRLAYATVLTLMAEWDQAPALAMAANRGPLTRRVFHILQRKPFGAGQRILGLTGSVLFLASALGAANALFGIAYPIPAASAKPSPAALANGVTHRTPPASVVPAADITPDQSGAAASQEPPQHADAAPQAEKLTIPLLVDLPASLTQNSIKPAEVASIQQALANLMAGLNGVPTSQTIASQPVAARARSCALPAIAGKMSLNPVAGTDLMTVPVEINGAPKQFLLDFGTAPSEISDPAVAELQLPQVDRNNASRAMTGPNGVLPSAPFFNVKGAGNPKDYRPRVRVASFTLGGATMQDMQFLIANDRDMGKSKPYDGRLTGSDFPQYDVNFDFGKRELSFLTPTSCADPDQVAYWPHAAVAIVPMSLAGGKMEVEVSIRGHLINAIIDTGSAHTVMRRDIAERLLGLQADTPEMMPAGNLKDGTGMRIYTHIFPQISFAGIAANNVPALIQTNDMVHRMDRTPVLGSRATFTADPGERIPDLTLGMDVLHQLHLYAAPGQNKLYVTSAENKPLLLSAE